MSIVKRTVSQKALFELISPENFTPRGNKELPAEAATTYRIPEHQRFPSWKLEKKQLLVDSVLRNFPMHTIIGCQQIDRDVEGEPIEIVNIEDGQSRLTALQEFLLNEYPTEEGNGPLDGKFFKELSPETKERFRTYQVTLEVLSLRGKESQDNIVEIFARLNGGKPITCNDKFHSRMETPVLKFVKAIMNHEDLQPKFRKYFGSIGKGPSRKGLADMVGAILALTTEDGDGKGCITTSYEKNHKFLTKEPSLKMKNDVVLFFKIYFSIIEHANEFSTSKPRKSLYYRLSGVFGYAVYCWITSHEILPEIEWYLKKLIKHSGYEPSTFKELTKGDKRNLQGESIARRLEKISLEYSRSRDDERAEDTMHKDDTESDSMDD